MTTGAGARRTSGFYEQDGAPAAHTGQAWLPCDGFSGAIDFLLTGQCGHPALDTSSGEGKENPVTLGQDALSSGCAPDF